MVEPGLIIVARDRPVFLCILNSEGLKYDKKMILEIYIVEIFFIIKRAGL